MTGLAFAFPLEGGLHARPAAALRLRALALGGGVELVNERSGRRAGLGDLLALLATDTRQGDPCRLLGPAATLEGLRAFLEGPFLDCDAVPAPAAATAGTVVPGLLARLGVPCWEGLAVAPGVGVGATVRLEAPSGPAEPREAAEPPMEAAILEEALARLESRLRRQAAATVNPVQRAVLEAHGAMALDRQWTGAMAAAVLERRLSAPAAAREVSAALAATLRASDNPYLRERALDVEDLAEALVQELTGSAPAAPVLDGPSVLVARDLTPGRLLALDRTHLRGLVLTEGGGTSHTAILARSFGLPCVAGLTAPLAPGQRVLVDGELGLVVPEPPAELLAYYGAARPARAAQAGPVTLRANILAAQETAPALAAGARGVGLFRTEMLFLDRSEPPSEDEQCAAYREALDAAQGQPVVLRLLDVGGDKPLPYLPLAPEANPFLGCRGVRWYAAHPGLIRTQVRAALCATLGATLGAGQGELRLMVPMVAEVEEMAAVRALVAACAAELGAAMPALGLMVEVPAAVLNLDALAREADFFCVGSNDLVQYLFAADRGAAQAHQEWHPATLRALAEVVRGGLRTGRPVSLCGEMAGRPRLLPLLAGLGFRELSLAPALLPALGATLAALDLDACAALAARALQAGSAAEVGALLDANACRRAPGPLLAPELILDATCLTKEEALKVLVEHLAAQGRTAEPRALEEALWARERVYATGVGFGFAVPHCQSAAVDPSLAVLRLGRPLDWGSLDGQPVDHLFLLALGAQGAEAHLRVFARLARKLVDPAFRAAVREAAAPQDLIALLQSIL